MEIIQVTRETASDFEEVLGPDLTADMSRSFFRGLAAVDEDRVCQGVLIYELSGVDDDDVKSMIWLLSAGSDEVRRKLMDEYGMASYEEDVEKSCFETSDAQSALFLEKMGFSNQSAESRELCLTVADLAKIAIPRKRTIPKYIKSLKEIPVLQYRNFIKKVIVNGKKGSVDDLAYLPMSWFAREASFCSVSEGRIDGILLVRERPSGEIRPQLYVAFGPDYTKTLGYLLIHTVNYVLEHYPPETKVVVYRSSKHVAALTDKLLAGFRGAEIFMGNRDE